MDSPSIALEQPKTSNLALSQIFTKLSGADKYDATLNFHETLRCDDGGVATTNDMCASATCQGCPIVTTACDSGTWDMSTGQCSATLPPDGTTCDSETIRCNVPRHSNTTNTLSPKFMNRLIRIVRQSLLSMQMG